MVLNTSDSERGSAATVERVLAHRLTLVVAGPGWGKSTFIRRVASATTSVEVTRPPSGWTAFALTRALLDAIGAGERDDLPAYPSVEQENQAAHAAALAAGFAAVAAERIAEPTVVLLDDAEWPAGDPLSVFLETLVLHLPAHLHLVVAARSAPALRIARLRAAGEVLKIGRDDLAVKIDDIATFDDGALSDPTSRDTLRAIIDATGGWPLAVHLATALVRRDGSLDREQVVERLLAPDAVLFDYLAEEIVAGLGPAERELLTLVGVLPQVSSALLAAVGRDDLAALIERFAVDRIFVEPVTSSVADVRATVLGRQFVRRALPAPDAELVDRIADASVTAGDVGNALHLAAQSGSPPLVVRVLGAVQHRQLVEVPHALEAALDVADRGDPHPLAAELRGDLHYRSGRWDEALAAYSRAVAIGGDAAGATRLIRKQAAIHYLRGDLAGTEEVCRTAVLDGSDPCNETWVLTWRAVVAWNRADRDGCAGFVEPAEQLAAAAGDDSAWAAVYTAKAMLAALDGDLAANLHWYERAFEHARRGGDVVQVIRIHANRGSRLTEEGRYSEALEELDAAIALSEVAGSDTFTALAFNNRGEAHLALGNLDDALAALREAERIWTRLGSRRVLYAVGNLGVVQYMRGQRAQAIALFREAIRLAAAQRDLQGEAASLVGLARALELERPDEAAELARRAIDSGQAIWLPHALVTAGSIALRMGDRAAAQEWAHKASALAADRRDRPALAESLLLQAAIDEPPDVALAEEAGRLWNDLGSRIGRARADLLVAQSRSGRQRDELVADAERVLYDAGALGYLAEWRQVSAGRTPPEVAIYTLGGFRVVRRGHPVDVGEWGSRKARDLVKLLIARRGAPVVRDEALDVLWPDSDDRSPRRLSVLLSTVRNVLDPDKAHEPEYFVNADHDTMWLVRDHVELDVETFIAEAADGRRLLAAGDQDKAHDVLSDAAARYVGDFCADDPYVDWLAGIRDLAKHTFVDTSFELAGLAGAAGEHSEAIRHWLRILDVDPYDEDAYLGMIESLLAQRRHGEARRAYRSYCARLAELDIEPGPFPG